MESPFRLTTTDSRPDGPIEPGETELESGVFGRGRRLRSAPAAGRAGVPGAQADGRRWRWTAPTFPGRRTHRPGVTGPPR